MSAHLPSNNLRSVNTFASIDVLSAALDSGVAIAVIVIFFTLQYPRNGDIGENTIMTWWGNTVFMNTGDWDSVVLKQIPEGESFGYVIMPFACSCH